MRQLFTVSILASLLVMSGCFGRDQAVTPEPDENVTVDVPEGSRGGNQATQAPFKLEQGESADTSDLSEELGEEEDGMLAYFSGELAFDYPEEYAVEEGEVLTVRGENGRVEIFKDFERTEFEEPQEQLFVGRETYGYDVWLYYSDDEIVRSEVREIGDSVQVLQNFRNSANAFTVYFPQDWYFNFEQNDLNCLSPYEKGAISSAEDCPNALIQLHVKSSLEEAQEFADGLLEETYVVEVNTRAVVLELADPEYTDIAEDILYWSFGD